VPGGCYGGAENGVYQMPAHLATLADSHGVLARLLRYSRRAPLRDAREGHHPWGDSITMTDPRDTYKPLTIDVDDTLARAWFGELLKRGDDLQPLMRDIGEILTKSTQQRFRDGVGPDGIAWEPLADGSGRTPLLDTGRMRDEIFPSSGEDWVEISAAAKQARWHQEGVKAKDRLIAPRKAEINLDEQGRVIPLAEGQHRKMQRVSGPARKFTHPGLPARPFIGLSEDDREAISRTAAAWMALTSD